MIFFLFKVFTMKKMLSGAFGKKRNKKNGAGSGGCFSCIFGGGTAAEPTSLLDAAETTSGEEAAGWLTKKGAQRKNWKKRWFVVKDGTISYYVAKGGERKGGFDLEGVRVRIDKGAENANTFRVSPRDGGRVYEVYAESPKQMHLWIKKIEDVARAMKEGRHGTLDEAGEGAGSESGSVVNPLSDAPRKQSLLRGIMGQSTGTVSVCLNLKEWGNHMQSQQHIEWLQHIFSGYNILTQLLNAICFQHLGKPDPEDEEKSKEREEAVQQARRMAGYLSKKGKGEVTTTVVPNPHCSSAQSALF
jgi:hypothetical protein